MIGHWNSPALHRLGLMVALAAGFLTAALPLSASERPRVYTNEQYIEDVTKETSLPIDDPKAMFAFVLESLPERVKVYPTENYYYFYFYHRGTRYAGNIRLDVADRDQGKVHFAYYTEISEWRMDDAVQYNLFGKDDGILVEKVEPLMYRVAIGGTSVVFELNDLSKVVPPAGALGTDDRYLGPVFDESGIRFFLIFNRQLKLFHYVLDETAPVPDELIPSQYTERILIGRRTGFAFYNEHRLDRKILIGVFETNASVNNYYDGPFDQLPDNFIEGDALRDAILAVAPEMKGRIDRYGSAPDGSSRYLIGPYVYYRTEQELLPFHECATDENMARELYHACFVASGGKSEDDPGEAPAREGQPPDTKSNPVK
jgi:hypothetical protein